MTVFKRSRRRSGVALIMCIAVIAILTIMVTDMAYTSRVRQVNAYHHRNRVQAYWLAKSGINIFTIFIVLNNEATKQKNKQNIPEEAQALGLGEDRDLWRIFNPFSSGFLRMMLSAGPTGDVDEEAVEEFKSTGQVTEEVAEESIESSLFKDKNFLNFTGDFTVEVVDNESKIDITQFAKETGNIQESITAQRLFGLMSGEEHDQWFSDRNIDRWELISNIRDWIDKNTERDYTGGYEDGLYDQFDPPYLSKNAPMDSFGEIHLIEGWEGEVFDKFGQYLTIWSNGKFNLNSVDDEMHKAIIRATAKTPTNDAALDFCMNKSDGMLGTVWDLARLNGQFRNSTQYVKFVQTNCGIELNKSKLKNLTSTSKVFTLTSTGYAGYDEMLSQVTITTVIDFSRKSTGKVRYWRID